MMFSRENEDFLLDKDTDELPNHTCGNNPNSLDHSFKHETFNDMINKTVLSPFSSTLAPMSNPNMFQPPVQNSMPFPAPNPLLLTDRSPVEPLLPSVADIDPLASHTSKASIPSCLLDDPNIDSLPPPTIAPIVLPSHVYSTVDKTAELTLTTSSLVFTTLQLTHTNSDSVNLLQNKSDSTLIENNSSLPSLNLCVQTYFKNHMIEKFKHNLLRILRNEMIKSNFNISDCLLYNQKKILRKLIEQEPEHNFNALIFLVTDLIRLQVIDSPQTLNICDLYQNIPNHVSVKNAILSTDNCRVAYIPVTAFTPDHSFQAPSNTCKPVTQTTNKKVDGPTSLYGIAKQATKQNITIQFEPSLTMILIIFSGLQHHL